MTTAMRFSFVQITVPMESGTVHDRAAENHYVEQWGNLVPKEIFREIPILPFTSKIGKPTAIHFLRHVRWKIFHLNTENSL